MNLHSALVTIAPHLSETARDELLGAVRDAASAVFDQKTQAVRASDVTAADIFRSEYEDLSDAADYLEGLYYPKPSDPLERRREARAAVCGYHRADALLDA